MQTQRLPSVPILLLEWSWGKWHNIYLEFIYNRILINDVKTYVHHTKCKTKMRFYACLHKMMVWCSMIMHCCVTYGNAFAPVDLSSCLCNCYWLLCMSLSNDLNELSVYVVPVASKLFKQVHQWWFTANIRIYPPPCLLVRRAFSGLLFSSFKFPSLFGFF